MKKYRFFKFINKRSTKIFISIAMSILNLVVLLTNSCFYPFITTEDGTIITLNSYFGVLPDWVNVLLVFGLYLSVGAFCCNFLLLGLFGEE